MRKTCTVCGERKPLADFPVLKAGVGGRHSQCRECRKEYFVRHNRKRYHENPKYREEHLNRTRERHANSSERIRDLIKEAEFLTAFGTPEAREEFADSLTYSDQYMSQTLDELAAAWQGSGRDRHL